jgi:hypothetical protein
MDETLQDKSSDIIDYEYSPKLPSQLPQIYPPEEPLPLRIDIGVENRGISSESLLLALQQQHEAGELPDMVELSGKLRDMVSILWAHEQYMRRGAASLDDALHSAQWLLIWLTAVGDIQLATKLIYDGCRPTEQVLVEALRRRDDEYTICCLYMLPPESIVARPDLTRWACGTQSALVINRMIKSGYVADPLCFHYVIARSDIGIHTVRAICSMLASDFGLDPGEAWYIECLRYSGTALRLWWRWGQMRDASLDGRVVDACIALGRYELLPIVHDLGAPLTGGQWPLLRSLSSEKRLELLQQCMRTWGALPDGYIDSAIVRADMRSLLFLRSNGCKVSNARYVLQSFMHSNLSGASSGERLAVCRFVLTELNSDLVMSAIASLPTISQQLCYDADSRHIWQWIADNVLASKLDSVPTGAKRAVRSDNDNADGDSDDDEAGSRSIMSNPHKRHCREPDSVAGVKMGIATTTYGFPDSGNVPASKPFITEPRVEAFDFCLEAAAVGGGASHVQSLQSQLHHAETSLTCSPYGSPVATVSSSTKTTPVKDDDYLLLRRQRTSCSDTKLDSVIARHSSSFQPFSRSMLARLRRDATGTSTVYIFS